MDEIKVTVCDYGPKRNLMLRYVDPVTGKQVAKTSGTKDPDKALMAAGKWEDELRSGRYQAPSKLTWAEFRKRYEAEKLAAMPYTSRVAYRVALDHLQRIIDPDRVAKVTPQAMSRFQAASRAEGMKETTLARHLRHIKAALRWGERQGLIHKAPAIEMPKLGGGYLGKHRAITAEEFDRLVAVLPKVRKADAAQFQRLAKGLWLSGLRLSEALALDWSDGPFVLDTSGKHPRFVIQASGQKSRKSELAPVTPDFATWILGATPEAQRVGKVFPMVKANGKPLGRCVISLGIRDAGDWAGIVVGETEKVTKDDAGRVTRETVKLTATAHDLRRAFCTRWAKRVMPPVLQKLARHGNVATTMSYYVNMGADDVAADLWANHPATEADDSAQGNTLGNTAPKTTVGSGRKNGRKSLS